eukprot:TRINITY_DN8959_c0_g1_i4.p1 TRINITY_DN8959_c0_g1~~TRINITY_DN8959_c0_g1_i4.p1  ORF type:complete len:395 (-),score=73.78 TRINITY_DN8959_c0_g1_i4:50-1165(-)
MAIIQLTTSQLPENVDWRGLGAVNPVWNETVGCSAAPMMALVDAVSSQLVIQKNAPLVTLSAQELVDCPKGSGCSGVFMDTLFEYVKENGLQSDECYRYKNQEQQCQALSNTCDVVTKISGYENFTNNDLRLIDLVANKGPVICALSLRGLSDPYTGGVLKDSRVCDKNSDHVVLVVGYGVARGGRFKEDVPYWLIKNEWAQSWGSSHEMQLVHIIPISIIQSNSNPIENGLQSDECYRYKNQEQQCQALSNTCDVVTKISGYENFTNNDLRLIDLVANKGPVICALSLRGLSDPYTGGVLKDSRVCDKNSDHVVLVVGYGVARGGRFKEDVPYWLIKNEWAQSWGEAGYLRLYRSPDCIVSARECFIPTL